MNCAMCWDALLSYYTTYYVSPNIKLGPISQNVSSGSQSAGNQQCLLNSRSYKKNNIAGYLVGTSETTRAKSFSILIDNNNNKLPLDPVAE